MHDSANPPGGSRSVSSSAGQRVGGGLPGRVEYIAKDHYDHDRYQGAAADVGAVESPDGGK
jgi:hypothetical protein